MRTSDSTDLSLLVASASCPASSATAAPVSSTPEFPRNWRRAACMLGAWPRIRKDMSILLWRKVEPREHAGDDSVAACAGKGKGVFERKIDFAGQGFAQQPPGTEESRAHRGLGY